MEQRSERAFTLIETLAAVAVVAVSVGGLIAAMGAYGRFATHQAGPVRSAAMLLAEQTIRVAQNAWKYGSPGSAPAGSWQTTVPLNAPSSAPSAAPVTITAAVSGVTAQTAQLTVTVRYTPDADHLADSGQISISAPLQVQAPVPGATILNPSLIPQPSGAP